MCTDSEYGNNEPREKHIMCSVSEDSDNGAIMCSVSEYGDNEPRNAHKVCAVSEYSDNGGHHVLSK